MIYTPKKRAKQVNNFGHMALRTTRDALRIRGLGKELSKTFWQGLIEEHCYFDKISKLSRLFCFSIHA